MVTAYLKEREWGEPQIRFEIPLPGREPVFMSMDITEIRKGISSVVIIDAQKFLHLWRADPHDVHRNLSSGTPETWLNDYKYGKAADGFSHGRENPVPLADVSYEKFARTRVTHKFFRLLKIEHQEEFDYVTFMDGITRTIWLLTQGCAAFPVKCGTRCAHALFHAAAAEGTLLYSVGEFHEALPFLTQPPAWRLRTPPYNASHFHAR